MDKLELTGIQFVAALAFLATRDISGNEFCRMANSSSGAQTHWRRAGIRGAAAKVLYDIIGEAEWKKITGGDNAVTGLSDA